MAKKKVKKSVACKRGKKFVCNECGLIVSVNKVCDCTDECDILCCGKPMKAKKK